MSRVDRSFSKDHYSGGWAWRTIQQPYGCTREAGSRLIRLLAQFSIASNFHPPHLVCFINTSNDRRIRSSTLDRSQARMAQPDGLLPYWLLLVSPPIQSSFDVPPRPVTHQLQTSLMAFIHSIACYILPASASLRQFSGPQRPPPTPLLAHVYSMKNIYTAAIRAYAAYDITNDGLYNLAILTYIGVLWLFVTELLVYRTARMKELVFPFVNAGVGVVWMVSMKGWYLDL